MLDIHTHLYWKSYDADRDEVVARARAVGVKEMLVIGCTVDESRQAIAVAEKYPDMYAAVGIHPHEFNKQSTTNSQQLAKEIEDLRELAQNKKVVAIGECGLDYYIHQSAASSEQKTISSEQKAFQKEGFLAQIELAQELKLPIIVHCRASIGSADAYEDMFSILKNHLSLISHPVSHFVLHCYMGDTEVTQKFLTLPNIYFSFTGNVTYPVKKAILGTNDDLTETVKLIPLDRIFTETDCPFLTPQSQRGERNEPAYVRETLGYMASLLGVEVSLLEQTTENNFKKVFNQF